MVLGFWDPDRTGVTVSEPPGMCFKIPPGSVAALEKLKPESAVVRQQLPLLLGISRCWGCV